MIMFIVNGNKYEFFGDLLILVLWYFCDELNFIGFKFGCGMV